MGAAAAGGGASSILMFAIIIVAIILICRYKSKKSKVENTNENDEYAKKREQERIAFEQKRAELKRQGIPSCPRCGSTYITAGARGYSIVTGFIGSGKTVNRCANCGHTWSPK